jgi:hypothetical protein
MFARPMSIRTQVRNALTVLRRPWRSGDGFLDDGIAVLGRHEAGFEGRRREVHAGIQHLVEEAVEALLVALHDLGVAGRHLRIEVQAEHAADGIAEKVTPAALAAAARPSASLRVWAVRWCRSPVAG